jgi:hypothetical protein
LLDAADAFSKIPDKAKATALAVELFGRSGAKMLPLLSKGRAGLGELYKQFDELGGGLDSEFIHAADEANGALVRFRLSWSVFASKIATEVLPVATRVLDWIAKTTAAFVVWIRTTYGVRTALMAIFGGGVALGIMKVVQVLGLAEMALSELLVTFLEFAWPVALIGALYLLFDDLYTMIEGGDSVIGRLLDNLGGVGAKDTVVNGLKDAFALLKETASEVGVAFEVIGSVALRAFAGALPVALKVVVDFLQLIASGIAAIGAGLSATIHDVTAAYRRLTGDKAGAKAEEQAAENDASKLFQTVYEIGGGKGQLLQKGGEDNYEATARSLNTRKGTQFGPEAPGAAPGTNPFETNPDDFGAAPTISRKGPKVPASVAGAKTTKIVTDNSRTTNNTTVNVQTDSRDPHAVGTAASKGVRKAHEDIDTQATQMALDAGF